MLPNPWKKIIYIYIYRFHCAVYLHNINARPIDKRELPRPLTSETFCEPKFVCSVFVVHRDLRTVGNLTGSCLKRTNAHIQKIWIHLTEKNMFSLKYPSEMLYHWFCSLLSTVIPLTRSCPKINIAYASI